MAQRHHIVANVDAGKILRRRTLQLSALRNCLHTIIYSRNFWKQSYSKNSFAFSRMTDYCNRAIRSCADYDIIFQTQCKFSLTNNPDQRPYIIYTDLTQKLTDRLWDKWGLQSTPGERTKWYRLEAEAFHRADKILTFNDMVKSSFVEDYGIPAEKVVVVGSGVHSDRPDETQSPHKDRSDIILFFLCTDFERQGGAAVIESYQVLKQKIPGIKLIIGGNVPRKLPDQAELYQHPPRADLEKLMDRATIFLMPGRLGGLQSVLEAMSRKCVCIVGATNVLLSEVIENEKTGIVIQSDDANQLAEKVIELYRDPARQQEIADQAHQLVMNHFTWDHVVRRMTAVFDKIEGYFDE